MKKKLLSFLALFISLSIYFSCTDEGVEVSGLQRINPDSDLLAYAMNLVGENGEGCSLIDFQKGNSNSRAVTDYSTVATPLWDKAKTEHHGDEEVLIVPLQGEDDIHSSMYFEEEEMGRLYQTKTFSKLVIRSKNGVNTPQILTYLPGRNYAKNRQAVLDTMGFSPLDVKYYGTILVSNLDGEFLQGFFYERGVPTLRLKEKEHTHTDASCSEEDTTVCNHHNHSHTINVRLNLSRNMKIVSRSTGDEDETSVSTACTICGSVNTNCPCKELNAEHEDSICSDCKYPKTECLCPPKCDFCGQRDCVCALICVRCKKYPCACEKRCQYCNMTFCKGECRNTSPDGGGDSGEEVVRIAPNAKALFFNPNLLDADWLELENMIEEIKNDDLGDRLFNALKNPLNVGSIHIQFSENPSFRFSSFDPAVGITLSREAQSFHLLYEMMHAYRAKTLSSSLYYSSQLNGVIEALYAQRLYVSRLSGFRSSDWGRRYVTGMIYEDVKKLEDVLDNNGLLKSGKNLSDVISAVEQLVNSLRKSAKYSSYTFEESQNGLENFSLIRTLTIGI